MTFADWQSLSPSDAARLIARRAAALPTAQHRAIFAQLVDEDGLAAAFARSELSADAPLARVPCLLKDVFDVGGWPTRAGSSFLPEVRPAPATDGTLARDLRSAGLVIAGKTHLYEFAYGLTGENSHHGNVEHPRFAGRTSGGSSSGSAAAVAAGVVPLAFGTDTAGSIRVPASFCGLFGFRLTPAHPWIADAFPLAPGYDTPGWFTARADNMAATLRAWCAPRADDSRGFSGAWLELPGADEDVASAQRSAAARLAPPLVEPLARRLLDILREVPAAFAALRSAEAWAVHAPWAEKMASGYSPEVFARLAAGRGVTRAVREAALAVRERLREAFSAIWARHDFLVLPATPCVAPIAKVAAGLRDRILAFTTPVSFAGLPALTVPVALAGGLTAGLQIVAPRADSPAFLRILEMVT